MHNFSVTVFLPLIDAALLQLQEWYQGMKTVHSNFEFLIPIIFSSKKSKLIKAAYDFVVLSKWYVLTFLENCYHLKKKKLKDIKLKTIRDISDFIFENNLRSVYSDVMTTFIIFLTLPVSIYPTEHYF